MRRLGIFSHESKNAEWQDAIITKLDMIVESQNNLRKEVADHIAEGRPTSLGRIRALSYLSVTLLLIIISVSATILSSTYHDEAQTAFGQAQPALEQVNKDLQPLENLVANHGAAYALTHASKSDMAAVEAAQGPAKQVAKYNAEGNDFETKSFASEYAGEILLAISSACFGAIAGWLLIPALIERRQRHR